MFVLVTYIITIVGGLNWLCIGLFQFDAIAGIFGSQAHFISRFLYCIIGLCGLITLIAVACKKGRVYEPKNAPKSTKTNSKSPSKVTKTQKKSILIKETVPISKNKKGQ